MIIDWDSITSDDVVIIPAFGTTLELEQKIRERGIDPALYETYLPICREGMEPCR
jgi:4-hydroxy-3-methylbut-2-enyl diphosphate reductase